jgi:hypothetical protein
VEEKDLYLPGMIVKIDQRRKGPIAAPCIHGGSRIMSPCDALLHQGAGILHWLSLTKTIECPGKKYPGEMKTMPHRLGHELKR